MIKQLARLIAEGSILLLVLLLLKNEVFPFYMSIWYPAGEHAEKMRDLIYLIVGMVTAFVYVGIGSSSRHAFQLSFFQSATVFFFWHSPFIFAG